MITKICIAPPSCFHDLRSQSLDLLAPPHLNNLCEDYTCFLAYGNDREDTVSADNVKLVIKQLGRASYGIDGSVGSHSQEK